jgi:hypothetical protein
MDLTTKPLHTDNATDITKIVCQHCLTSTDAITFRWKHWIEGSESDDTSEYVRDAVQKGREIARKLQSSFSSLQFHYGAETTFEDITPKVLSSCIEPVEMQMGSHRETKWCIVIPASYKTRDEKFGDPLYGFHKQINVFYGTMVLVYREDDSIIIPIL